MNVLGILFGLLAGAAFAADFAWCVRWWYVLHSLFVRTTGLRKTAPAIASVVALAEPISASLFGVVVLGEQLAIAQLTGIVIILVTVTVLSVASSRR